MLHLILRISFLIEAFSGPPSCLVSLVCPAIFRLSLIHFSAFLLRRRAWLRAAACKGHVGERSWSLDEEV